MPPIETCSLHNYTGTIPCPACRPYKGPGVSKRPKRPRCVGLMGRLLGHRFTVNVGDMAYKTPYCGRCGFVPERLRSEQVRGGDENGGKSGD